MKITTYIFIFFTLICNSVFSQETDDNKNYGRIIKRLPIGIYGGYLGINNAYDLGINIPIINKIGQRVCNMKYSTWHGPLRVSLILGRESFQENGINGNKVGIEFTPLFWYGIRVKSFGNSGTDKWGFPISNVFFVHYSNNIHNTSVIRPEIGWMLPWHIQNKAKSLFYIRTKLTYGYNLKMKQENSLNINSNEISIAVHLNFG